MTKKTDLPSEAPQFAEGEWAAIAATLISCSISALALSWHVWDKITVDNEFVKWAFTILFGLFALVMGIVPMMLARAHGSAMEGGPAQSGLLFVVFLFMLVDGALQFHAISYVMELMGATAIDWVWPAAGAAAFQIAAFFARGLLFAVTREIQELIDARAHESLLARNNVRALLEREATELNIIFDGRTSDSILQSKIHQRRMHIAA
jgi:hypothetical protein